MKYMLLIYQDEQSWKSISEPERQQIYREYRNLRAQLESRKQFVSGSELQRFERDFPAADFRG